MASLVDFARHPRLPSHFCKTRFLLLFAATLSSSHFVAADDAAKSATAVQKIKRATVYLRVKLPTGEVQEGSGFFVADPGTIVTNAHVLGMLEPNSRQPLQIEVVVNAGETDSRTFGGRILGVDRGTDLAVLRIQGKDLPAPLQLGSAKDLTETQEVRIFGFPFGRQLGKEITVSQSSVSSLRKKGGTINRIQVNGGINPGNSGGPVTDAANRVVGVAVSGVKGTQIHFAIPAEHVTLFLNGRPDLLVHHPAYKEKDRLLMPVEYHVLDPLGRVRQVSMEVWTGKAGASRPGAIREPAPKEGDSEKKVFPMKYDKKGTAIGEIVLPPLADAKDVYWLRAVIVNGESLTIWTGGFVSRPVIVERKAIRLKYNPAASKLRYVDLTSNATLRLRTEIGEEHSIKSNVVVGLGEQPDAAVAEGNGSRFRLNFRQWSLGFFVDDKLIKGNEDIHKLFNNLKLLTLNVDMDGDGSPTRTVPDFTRVPTDSREALSDVADQVLQSLRVVTTPLPGDEVKPLQTWKTQSLLEIGPLGMALPAQANLKFTYLGVRESLGQQQAVIQIEGGLRGRRGNESHVGGTVSGTLFLAPETGQLVSGNATLKVDMDLAFKKQPVKANGLLQVRLNRSETPPAAPKKK